MDIIAKLPETSISSVLLPSNEAFAPLLKARRPQISQTPKRTFKFGSTDRHQIDVYYPPSGTSNAPILFFVYGGGFNTGSRTIIPGVHFDNLGAFFAQRGILTAVADYRLAPETLYPGAVLDIRDAIRFALSSPDVDVTGHGADKTRVYVMGHSAGGTHVATMFLNEDILGEEERAVVKGVIFNSPAYGSNPALLVYYGDPIEEMPNKCPLGHLSNKSPDKLKQLLPPRVFLLSSERDPPGLITTGQTFRDVLREKGINDFHDYTIMGHNHVSPNLALYSGEGEEWGEEVAKWIKA